MLFHGTLQRWAQLVDELPMLYGISVLIYAIFCLSDKTPKWVRILLSVILFIICQAVTLVMHWYPEYPEFFFATFGVFTSIVCFTLLYKGWNMERSVITWIEMATLILTGFTTWNLENAFCQHIEFLKFHTLWHIFSAWGTIRLITLMEYVYYQYNGHNVKLVVSGLHYIVPTLDFAESSKKE